MAFFSTLTDLCVQLAIDSGYEELHQLRQIVDAFT